MMEWERLAKEVRDMRPEVLAFAMIMERKLSLNDHKGGWGEETRTSLMRRLREECDELELKLTAKGDHALAIADEAVDVANFAMMIACNFGGSE